jgi:DNA-directed RNA polymerase subunit RPC12/RpoP
MISEERYECSKCGKKITHDEAMEIEDWRCPNCGRRILIYVKREKLPDMVLERKLIDDVKEGDDFFSLDDYHLYEVFGKKEMSKNRVKLMLRGYGSITFKDDEYINCRANFGYNED